MAERRMFAKSIVLSDAFLDMPMSARCLYFTLGMLADDDGFVGNPKSIMRQCGATNDDMLILLQKRYVLGFENGVIVIKHWKMNNYLQTDRHKKTTYIEELNALTIDSKGAYTEKDKISAVLDTNCIQSVYTGKDSIGKDSIGNNTVGEKRERFTPPTIEEIREYCTEKGYNVDAEKFWNYYDSIGWVRGKNKMKKWKSAVAGWNARENPRGYNSDNVKEEPKKKERSYSQDEFERLLGISEE